MARTVLAILVLLFLHANQRSVAQWYKLRADTPNKPMQEVISVKDTTKTSNEATRIIQRHQLAGYLAAGIDSVISDSLSGNRIHLYRGRKFYWGEVSIDSSLRSKPVLNRKLRANFRGTISHEDFNKARAISLQHFTNSGYPYAMVWMENLQFSQDSISAYLRVAKGSEVQFDSLIIHGAARISTSYLLQYLGIKKGDLFNESVINAIPAKLARLPYLRSTQPPALELYERTADIHLYLGKEKASHANGLIGVGRSNQTGKTEITGEIDLSLQNTLTKGETIVLYWKKISAASQKLHAGLQYPGLFGSAIGINANFSLYQQDSSYLTVSAPLGVRFLMSGSSSIGVHYQWDRSIVQDASRIDPKRAGDTTNLIDFKRRLAGADLSITTLDRSVNPTRGQTITLGVSGGYRTILKNPEIAPERYDSVDIQSTTLILRADLCGYLPLYKGVIVKGRITGGWIMTRQVYLNEMYQVGGLQSLRGFDEDFFRTPAYGIGSIELRYQTTGYNSLFLFYDQGALTQANQTSSFVFPFGFGAGTNLEIRSGIFTLVYGIGKRPNEPLSLREARIHFGITALF